MRPYKKKQKSKQVEAAKEIERLFEQAKSVYIDDPRLADKYVEHARKLSMKLKVRLTSEQKRLFCGHCHCFMMPRVRLTGKTITYYCNNCKKHNRIGYKGD